MSKTIVSIFYLFAIVIVHAQESDDYWPGKEWRVSAPADQGLDGEKLDAFVRDLSSGKLLKPVNSLTIIKNGYMVVDKYFGEEGKNDLHTLQSVTKSITSTLIGVAIQQDMIADLEQSVLSFFPEYSSFKHLDENKKAMTLKHCLTMRTGQAWTGESHLGALNRYSGDKMKYVLDYKMEGPPGNQWYYNSGIAILLGGLLQNATKMNTKDFAMEYLFEPLGITSYRWDGHRGIPHTGGGLYLTPRDMARIGYLYLKDGRWENNQILPENWVREATTRHVLSTQTIAGVSLISYGYMWWLLPSRKTDLDTSKPSEIYMAYGHWGQFIFIIPSYDMVVVFTNDRTASYYEEIRPISLLYDYILKSVR